MGLFDYLCIEDGADIELPGFSGDPTAVEWQTKTIRRPALEVYKITMDRRLYREDAHYETVPEADRPHYDEELGGFEEDWQKTRGMLRKIPQGWTDTAYHGGFEFHTTVDDEWYSYEATFTDGDLVAIERHDP